MVLDREQRGSSDFKEFGQNRKYTLEGGWKMEEFWCLWDMNTLQPVVRQGHRWRKQCMSQDYNILWAKRNKQTKKSCCFFWSFSIMLPDPTMYSLDVGEYFLKVESIVPIYTKWWLRIGFHFYFILLWKKIDFIQQLPCFPHSYLTTPIANRLNGSCLLCLKKCFFLLSQIMGESHESSIVVTVDLWV